MDPGDIFRVLGWLYEEQTGARGFGAGEAEPTAGLRVCVCECHRWFLLPGSFILIPTCECVFGAGSPRLPVGSSRTGRPPDWESSLSAQSCSVVHNLLWIAFISLHTLRCVCVCVLGLQKVSQEDACTLWEQLSSSKHHRRAGGSRGGQERRPPRGPTLPPRL